MMANQLQYAFIMVAIAFFIAMWCATSLVLGWLSGWFDLQQHYCDDGAEQPLLKLRWVSASMGSLAIYLKHCLFLAAKPTGLSVSMFRIFAPFQKPLLIPWNDIRVEQASSWGFAKIRLLFGDPVAGQLRINQWTWSRLVDVLPQNAETSRLKTPAQSSANGLSIAQNLFVQWLFLTAAISMAFYLLAQAKGGQHLPLPVMILVLGICCALGQVVRYVRLT